MEIILITSQDLNTTKVNTNINMHLDYNFAIPTICSQCCTPLVLSATGIDLFCPNSDSCPAQVIGRLRYYCQRNIGNIVGLSSSTIATFVDKYKINDIADLYNLPFDEIETQDGFGSKSVANLRQSVENSRVMADYKFLTGLAIEGVGIEVAKLICDQLSQNS